MGAYTLLQDLTVATNSTSVVLNDFGTITKDDFIKVVLTLTTGANGGDYNLTANGNNTTTNYHRQYILGVGSSVSAARNNNAAITATETGQTSVAIVYLKLSENDRLNLFANDNRRNDSSTQLLFQYVTSSGATFTSGITSLTLTGNTNAIGTGSRIQIYRLDAVKEADITVTSNTTQVDISNLSIDKDSEYLLVIDVIPNGSTGGDIKLAVNNITTNTSYFSQGIFGNGASAAAARVNVNRIGSTIGTNSLIYSHIKLSNIGAFTSQNYGIRGYGTTTPTIRNWFLSSTSEAITNITTLSVLHEVSNNIKAGSRFILYKLYE